MITPKTFTKKLIPPLFAFTLLLTLWELYVRVTGTPLYVLPAPSRILLAFITEFPVLLSHSMVTLSETVTGLIIAMLLGVITAIAMDASKLLKTALYPLLIVSQTIPIIVRAPIFVIYFGFGITPKVITIVLMCFFPIAVSFADGMAHTDENMINLVKTFGANPIQVYTTVKIPAAAISLFSGLRVSAAYSVTGAVVGEWLSSDSGLGYYMLRVKNGYMLDKVFASVLAVVILSLAMNGMVRLVQYITLPVYRQQAGEISSDL